MANGFVGAAVVTVPETSAAALLLAPGLLLSRRRQPIG
jgi:hypothetical protein